MALTIAVRSGARWSALLIVSLSEVYSTAAGAEIKSPHRLVVAQQANGVAISTVNTDNHARPDGVRLTTSSPTPTIGQGETILTTLDVQQAVAGQKIRIQNSNHGADYFTADFGAAVQVAIAQLPGISCQQVTSQQIEITLAAGTYLIPIRQSVTLRNIPLSIDDAAWAPGRQLQTDWLLSSAPSNGAPVEPGFTVSSKWITYAQDANATDAKATLTPALTPALTRAATPAPGAAAVANGPGPSDARWSLLRSIPGIRAGGTVRFEIGLTNYTLTAPTRIQIGVDERSTAGDANFTQGLDAAIAAALTVDVSYESRSHTLTFGPNAKFPFGFAMTATAVERNPDYVLNISHNQLGEIDVAQAGVRLGERSLPAITPMLGLNEASGEFGAGNYAFKYAYPGKDRIDWLVAQGFGIIRVPFLFQNIQAASLAPVDEPAMQHLDPVLNECAERHVVCLLDMHNYGSYYLDDSTSSQPPSNQGLPGTPHVSNRHLANLWGQIAQRYKANRFVWFDLMNEPNRQTALEWVKTANAIAAAIRSTGAANKIIFQGTAWQGAWTWTTSGNATDLLKAYDPGDNDAFEAHQYLDRDGSGTSPNCVAGAGAARLKPFTAWLRTYRLQGILGEIGWAANAACNIEARALLDHWHDAAASVDSGGYIGLTYWAAGPWWADGYMYLAEPRPFPSGPVPEQLTLLKRYLPH